MESKKYTFIVSAIQMVSSASVADNLAQAAELIASAAKEDASLVVLPEYFCFMGHKDHEKLALQETPDSGPIQDFLARQAQLHGLWLVGGTLPLRSPEPNKIYNSCLVYNPDGELAARYDKIHLFSFTRGTEAYDESWVIQHGSNAAQVFTGPWGATGLSVCYDLRFPELYRALGQVNLMLVPSAFTYTTGQAHWEILLRARAIENQCYVLAPAQGGKHENGRRTWGHSVLIDPWGDIIDCLEQGVGVVTGTIDLQRIADVRLSLPALKHRIM